MRRRKGQREQQGRWRRSRRVPEIERSFGIVARSGFGVYHGDAASTEVARRGLSLGKRHHRDRGSVAGCWWVPLDFTLRFCSNATGSGNACPTWLTPRWEGCFARSPQKTQSTRILESEDCCRHTMVRSVNPPCAPCLRGKRLSPMGPDFLQSMEVGPSELDDLLTPTPPGPILTAFPGL